MTRTTHRTTKTNRTTKNRLERVGVALMELAVELRKFDRGFKVNGGQLLGEQFSAVLHFVEESANTVSLNIWGKRGRRFTKAQRRYDRS